MSWQGVLSELALALAIPVAIAGFAAWANSVLRARRDMWQAIVQDKERRTDDFLASIRSVAEQIQLYSWLHTTHALSSPGDRFSNYALMLDRLRQGASESDAGKIVYMQNHVMPDYWPTPDRAQETEERAKALSTGIFNLISTRMMASQQDVQDAYARLSMVAFDPDKAGSLKAHVVAMADTLGKQFPGTGEAPDFDNVYREFREAQRYAIAYVRLDLQHSRHKFYKANAVSAQWLESRPRDPPTAPVK